MNLKIFHRSKKIPHNWNILERHPAPRLSFSHQFGVCLCVSSKIFHYSIPMGGCRVVEIHIGNSGIMEFFNNIYIYYLYKYTNSKTERNLQNKNLENVPNRWNIFGIFSHYGIFSQIGAEHGTTCPATDHRRETDMIDEEYSEARGGDV